MRKRQLVCFEEGLLAGVRVRPVERSSAGHGAHAKDVQLLLLAAQLRPDLIPVHLALHAPRVTLGYEGFPTGQTHLSLLPPDIPAHRTLGYLDLGHLLP